LFWYLARDFPSFSSTLAVVPNIDYSFPFGNVYLHSPEDLILYKLMYFGLSQQSKHSRDIAAILKSKKNELDMSYIEQWAARLGLSSLWKEMLDNIS
jgi:hypothetical protein